MARHGRDPKPNIPRDVAVLGVNTVKGFETERCTRLCAAPTVHPHNAALVEGPAGSQSCQMVNMMVDG